MSNQTETEKQISKIIKSYVPDVKELLLNEIVIQTFVKDNKRKCMTIKMPFEVLRKVRIQYGVILTSIKQRFEDYYIIFVENINLENGCNWNNAKKMFEGACFPYVMKGIRTDVISPEEEVIHVVVEKRCAFSKDQFEMIETAASGLVNRQVVIEVMQD